MTMFSRGALLLLYAETMSHVGAAESVTVDLAIQRNPLTRWPMIQSSSLKGALRAAAPNDIKGDYTDRTVVFGTDGADKPKSNFGESAITDLRSGLLSVGDASLLALPVASLAGIFGWITCPRAIGDFQRTRDFLPGAPAAASGQPPFDEFTWQPPEPASPDAAFHAADCRLFISRNPDKIMLQDTLLTSTEDSGLTAFAARLADTIRPGTAQLGDKLKRDLVLVHDDMFAALVEAGVHIVTRVKIDDESGTVGDGPWDVELLPAETILYAPLQARYLGNAPNGTSVKNVDDVITYLTGKLFEQSRRRFQIGAGATIGQGIMAGSVVVIPPPTP